MQAHEDAALAHMIQKEECKLTSFRCCYFHSFFSVEHHYARNKNQRIQVRTDGELRRAEQKVEEQLAVRARRLLQHEQERM